MNMPLIIAALNGLAAQSPLLFLLVDLTLKSTLILLCAGAAQLYFRGKSASERSTFWVLVVGSLLFLPLFHLLIPGYSITFAIDELELSRLLSSEMLAIVMGLRSGDTTLALLFESLAIAYAIVSLVLVLYLAIGLVRIVAMTRSALPCRDARAQSMLRRLLEANGITTPITLLLCPHCESPLTWGVGRHWIILPRAALRWERDLLEQSLSHELAHIRRRDWLCYIASRLAICVYWINPLVWFAHGKLVIESEKACDDAVLSDTGCSIGYAENLLQLATRERTFPALPAPALFIRRSSLVLRIQHILQQDKSHACDDRCGVLPGLLLAAVLVAPYSAFGITLHATAPKQTGNLMYRVNYFPKESLEYQQVMHEFGRA